MHLRKSAVLVGLVLLAGTAACSDGKSAAEKAKQAMVQAKASCDVFVGFAPPTGSDQQSQITATKETYDAFIRSANSASKAAALDPAWAKLLSAAERLAAAYEVLVRGTEGQAEVDRAAIRNAVKEARAARPIFLEECAKADPKNFVTPTASATPSPAATKTRAV